MILNVGIRMYTSCALSCKARTNMKVRLVAFQYSWKLTLACSFHVSITLQCSLF